MLAPTVRDCAESTSTCATTAGAATAGARPPCPRSSRRPPNCIGCTGSGPGEATYGSEKWLTALANAYDEWLQVACQYLAVTHHLARLDGLDRDIERLRVEGELVAAGLELPSVTRPPR